MTAKTPRLIIAVSVSAFVAIAAVVLYNFDPLTAGFYPQCPSRLLTGYDCAGCGSLRGIHALLHGDVTAAWHFNPAIFFALAALALIAMAGMHRVRPLSRHIPLPLYRFSQQCARVTDHPAFPLTLLCLIVAWTVIRNI